MEQGAARMAHANQWQLAVLFDKRRMRRLGGAQHGIAKLEIIELELEWRSEHHVARIGQALTQRAVRQLRRRADERTAEEKGASARRRCWSVNVAAV